MPPVEWQLRRRIGEACRRLERTDEAVTSIGFRLGFSSSQYFATSFRRVMGLSPTAFRTAARAGLERF
ncbi:MAG: helix-turn-helix domain-containing protein [Actinobacteria bacterium]|nr:helix-turn-helix domain-containing protein [Actinomycetota bacterium]